MRLISVFFSFTISSVVLHNNLGLVSAKQVVTYELDEADEDYYDDIQLRTRLYDNIVKGKWQDVKNTIAASPEEAATLLVKTKKGKYGTGGQITMKEMALHTIFDQERQRLTATNTNTTREPLPATVALKLINAHPSATHILNLDNWSPLHLACFANAPVPVLQSLIKHNPSPLTDVYRGDLYTPLHCAASHPTAPPEILKYLMEVEPPLASKTDGKSRTALHIALSSGGASLDSLKVLADQLPPPDRRIRHPSTLLHMVLRPSPGSSDGDTKKKKKAPKQPPIKIPLEVVQFVNSLNPMAVASPDKDGTLPLVAALETLSLNSSGVEFLLEQNPIAASYINPHNKTNPFVSVVALHGALKRYGIDKTSFDLIFNAWPEAASIVNHKGLVALHIAAKTGVTHESIMTDLITAYPAAVSQKDDKGGLPLHHVLKWKNKTIVETVVRAMLDVDIGVANVTNAGLELPLHVALKNAMGGEYMNQSTAIIDMILEANPWAVDQMDTSRHEPLRMALLNDKYLSLEVIQSIVRHCNECVTREDSYRNYPFHLACSYKKPQSAAVIKFLYEEFKIIATLPNDEQRHPLHLALHSGQDVDVIDLLLDVHPDAIQKSDANENYPLHYALLHPKKNYISVINRIIDAFPKAIKHTNKAKQLPLHTALATEADKSVTRKLLALNPESCDKPDEEKMTPLVYALRNEFSEAFIKMIFDVCPTAAKSNLYEIMIIQIAIVKGYSLDIIKMIVKQDPQSIMRVTDGDRNVLTWAAFKTEAGGGPGDDHTRAKILEFFLMTAPESFDGRLWLQVENNDPEIAPFAKGLLKKGRDYWRERAKKEGVVYWKDYPGMREELKRQKREEEERIFKEAAMKLDLEKMMARKKRMEGGWEL